MRRAMRVVEKFPASQGRSRSFEITPISNYVSIVYRFSDIQRLIMADTEFSVRGHSRSLKLIDHLRLLLVFRCNYSSILYHFRDKARKGKNRNFSYFTCFHAPIKRSPFEYCHDVWHGKSRMMDLSSGEKNLICLAVSIQYWRVMDRQTDILRQHNARYAYASRGN